MKDFGNMKWRTLADMVEAFDNRRWKHLVGMKVVGRMAIVGRHSMDLIDNYK